MEAHSIAQPGLTGSSRMARQLTAAAVACFIAFGTIALNILFPPSVSNPVWLMRLATGLVSSAYLPLIGLALVFLAAYLQPKESLESLRGSLAKWAVIVSLGFILLVPLQVWASWGLSSKTSVPLKRGNPHRMNPCRPWRRRSAKLQMLPRCRLS